MLEPVSNFLPRFRRMSELTDGLSESMLTKSKQSNRVVQLRFTHSLFRKLRSGVDVSCCILQSPDCNQCFDGKWKQLPRDNWLTWGNRVERRLENLNRLFVLPFRHRNQSEPNSASSLSKIE